MSAPPLPHLDNSIGTLYISALIGASLWGISCAQAWTYFLSRPKDPVLIKAAVWAALIFDTAQQCMMAQPIYTYLITHYGQPSYLPELPPTATPELLLVWLNTIIAQVFYIWRIWKLSKRGLVIVAPLFVLFLTESGVWISTMVFSARATTWADLVKFETPMNIVSAILVFAMDTLIAGIMCYLLYHSRTEYVRTNSIISRLVVFTMSSNLVTSICAGGAIVTELTWPGTLLFMPFFQNLMRLEMNSFLAALNMRPFLAGHSPGVQVTSDGIAMEVSASGGATHTFGGTPRNAVGGKPWALKVNTTVETSTDAHDPKYQHVV